MKCVKTGCDLYLDSREWYLHGDLFVPYLSGGLRNAELGLGIFDLTAEEVRTDQEKPEGLFIGVNLLMRVCHVSSNPTSAYLHVRAEREDHWFDEAKTSGEHNSVLLIRANQARWFGYGGGLIREIF